MEAALIMGVLQIIDNIKRDSGVTSVVMNIYRNIDRQKIQFDFLVGNKGANSVNDLEEEIKRLGGQVFYSGSPLSVRTFFSSQKYIKNFFKRKNDEYAVVHLHTPTMAEFTLKYAKRYGVINRITHSHSTMTSLNKVKKLINAFLIKRIKKYTTHYWACSTEAAEFLYGKVFCSNHKIELVKNGVNPDLFAYNSGVAQKVRDTYNLRDSVVVSHISNFSPIKNHAFLIEVIKQIKEARADIKFLFVGDGPTKQNFERAVEENQIGDVCVFVGRTDQVANFLMASDALILPSLKEGLPVSVIEAQAAGVPCWISDSITNEANVGNVRYLKLDTAQWVENLLALTRLDVDKRNEFAGVFAESDFNIEKEAKRLENIYFNIVGKGNL